MAYPTISGRIWWDLRRRFNQSPPRGEVTANYLADAISTSEKNAQNIVPALRDIGLIGEDRRLTDRAEMWRDDEGYASACREMIEQVYPQALLDVAPPPDPDLATVQRWFKREARTGQARANQMASFYVRLAHADLSEADEDAPRRTTERAPTETPPRKVRPAGTGSKTRQRDEADSGVEEKRPAMPGLSVAVQVYVDKDMTAEQVDHVFASMAKHLYGKG